MKISFDYQIFLLQRYGGISRYFLGVGNELSQEGLGVEIHAPFYINNSLRKSTLLQKPSLFLPRYSTKFNADRVVTYMSSRSTEKYLQKSKPDILHHTYYGADYLVDSKVPRFITVYDFIRERTSSEKGIARHKMNSILSADVVICISESTRNDLLNYVDVDESRVKVVPLSADSYFYDPQEPDAEFQKPYILYVGQRADYKNFALLLEAFSQISADLGDLNLNVFGGGPLSSQEKMLISSLSLEGRITKVDGDDLVLRSQYAGAQAFIYPSTYEGFGIPILEAMAVGCPVITSNTSSMPEVAGGAAYLFDPYNRESLTLAITEVISSNSLRNSLVQLGHLRAKQFSWSETARKTLDIYREVANVN